MVPSTVDDRTDAPFAFGCVTHLTELAVESGHLCSVNENIVGPHRSYGRHQQVLDLEHYLDVLEHKPGAFAGSKPLDQWRRAGRWPGLGRFKPCSLIVMSDMFPPRQRA